MRLGEERIQDQEEQYTEEIISIFRKSLLKEYAQDRMLRRFHPKSHGLVRAQFTVQADIPEHLKQGLFAAPRTFNCWIRFSNAPPRPTADTKGSAKGIAIKVLDTGKPTLEKDILGSTQDFILTTNSVLLPATVKKYFHSMRALFGSPFHLLAHLLNPANWSTLIRVSKGKIKTHNLLELQYFSGTAYSMGTGQAVKWALEPHKKVSRLHKDLWHKDHLRLNLQQDLMDEAQYFNFGIQLQEDAEREPIENTGVQWHTPFVKLAEVKIDKQIFDTIEIREKSEHMSFSPWHCMEEHRPLGGNNRVRRKVYKEMAALRLSLSKV